MTGAEALTNALWITVLGMGLVFVAIILLWGMMALMGRIPDGKTAKETVEVVASDDIPTLADSPVEAPNGDKAKAAALAVAVAMAIHQSRRRVITAAPADGNISPWQAVLRAGRLSQRNQVFSRKSRGIVR